MAKSKQYKDVVKLGKLLVKELGLEHSVDTLGRWMAHHISDLMASAETSEGPQKQEAEDRCRDAILALWKHSDVFQKSHTPLEETETLFATLRALDPENTAHFYYSGAQEHLEKCKLNEEPKKWLELSLGMDYTARLLLSMCLEEAAKDIMKNNEEWMELAKSLESDTPRSQLIRVLFNEQKLSEQEVEDQRIKETKEILQNRKSRLSMFVDLVRILDEKISNDIAALEESC